IEVENWILAVEREETPNVPTKEIIQSIYDIQKEDTEPPQIATIRYHLKREYKIEMTQDDLAEKVRSLTHLMPGFLTMEGQIVCLEVSTTKAFEKLNGLIPSFPEEYQKMYVEALRVK